MLPPRRDDQPACTSEAKAVLGLQFRLKGCQQFRQTGHRLVFVILRVREKALDLRDGLRRRAVVDHSLAKRDCSRMLADKFGDHRDYR